MAIIRVSGPAAKEALKAMTPSASLPKARLASNRRLYHPITTVHLDSALVLWFPGPRSYTGEDVVEFHVHGGKGVITAVLYALSDYGLCTAPPGEFTKRAFYNEKLDLTEVEGLSDLLSAETEGQRKQALRQMGGALKEIYQGWADRLLRCMAHCEAIIDFGEDQGLDSGVLNEVNDTVKELGNEIKLHLNDNRRGERLRDGVQVAIIGPPNAGKSSLLNFLTQRSAAIVSHVPGTTRDIIEAFLDLGGYPAVLADTAGIRSSTDIVEKEGIRRALQRAHACDIVVQVVDASQLESADQSSHGSILDKDLDNDITRILLVNKIDLIKSNDQIKLEERIKLIGSNHSHKVSLTEMIGLEEMVTTLSTIVKNKCENRGGSPTLTQTRHREALMHCLDCLERFEVAGDMVMAGEELRLAVRWLGEITGLVRVDDVLNVLFSDFCIGK